MTKTFDDIYYEKYYNCDNSDGVFEDVFNYFEKNIKFSDLNSYYDIKFDEIKIFRNTKRIAYYDILNNRIISICCDYNGSGIHIYIFIFNHRFHLEINKSLLGLLKYYYENKEIKYENIIAYIEMFSYDLFSMIYDLLTESELYNELR